MDYRKISAVLIGNATKDAEVKAAKESGNVYGDFTVAVKDRQTQATHYFPVRCFGKLAESVRNIKKGAKLFVEGELDLSAFAGEDGKKQVTFRVLANTYRILANRRSAGADEVPAASELVQADQ